MQQFIAQLATFGFDITPTSSLALVAGIMILTALVIHLILHRLVLRTFTRRAQSSHRLWLQIITQHQLFQRVALLLQGVIVQIQARLWLQAGSEASNIVTTCAQLWVMLYTLLAFFSLLDVILNLSRKLAVGSQLPLKGIFQGIKLVSAILVAILAISLLLGQSPAILISGLGAMAAVLMLVFKDPILGLVAGIQLSANDMLKLGDWLEMPKYGADGAVTDIGLTTVKVRNWDNTITTIPTWSLVSDSFKNWSGMSASGGRRIKRSIHIDTSTIHFLDAADQQRLMQARLLQPYMAERQQEIAQWNQRNNADPASNTAELSLLNQRKMTNVGTLRAYLHAYLRQHPHIHQGMTLMVRQLAPDSHGLPLEIYAFTNTVVWAEYETIQADIFDHLFAVIAEFGLKVHQVPSGSDLRALLNTQNG